LASAETEHRALAATERSQQQRGGHRSGSKIVTLLLYSG
jgi:hypothetical protein